MTEVRSHLEKYIEQRASVLLHGGVRWVCRRVGWLRSKRVCVYVCVCVCVRNLSIDY